MSSATRLPCPTILAGCRSRAATPTTEHHVSDHDVQRISEPCLPDIMATALQFGMRATRCCPLLQIQGGGEKGMGRTHCRLAGLLAGVAGEGKR